MSEIVSPAERIPSITVKGLIYGQPGCGKSTRALSAPNPVMIDADKGMTRVERRYQAPSLPLESFDQVLRVFEAGELKPFDSIIFDTAGKLVDRIGDYVMDKNPKARQGNGSLTMQGWGEVKKEFSNLLSRLQASGKNVIFIAHEREETQGDQKIVRPDIAGSSGKELVKELDFMGYMEVVNDRRTICFSPSERFYAKNSIGLTNRIEVPTLLEETPNKFIENEIIERTKQRKLEDDRVAEEYENLVYTNQLRIDAIEGPEDAQAILTELKQETPHIWDSYMVLRNYLHGKLQEKGIHYDKKAGEFYMPESANNESDEQAEAPGEDEQEEQAAEGEQESYEEAGPDKGDAVAADAK